MTPGRTNHERTNASHSRFLARFGPVAVVTGASSGIGKAFAQQLAARGINLLLVGRRDTLLDELAQSLSQTHGVSVSSVATDLAEPSSIQAVVRAVANREVGLLVCSAGFGTSGPFIEGNFADERSMVDVNCRSLMALMSPMQRAHGGRRHFIDNLLVAAGLRSHRVSESVSTGRKRA